VGYSKWKIGETGSAVRRESIESQQGVTEMSSSKDSRGLRRKSLPLPSSGPQGPPEFTDIKSKHSEEK